MGWDLLMDTLQSVRSHALRFLLTSLGIFWGVTMLTYLSATSTGYDVHFEKMIQKIGHRIIYLFPGVISKDTAGERGSRDVIFEMEDVRRVADLNAVDRAAPNLFLGARIYRLGQRSKLIWTYGANEFTLGIRNFEIAEGRAINKRDVDDRSEVVFLGHLAAKRIFGNKPALGRTLHIESIPFRVVGISKEKGDQMIGMGPRDDEVALIPVTTAQRWFTLDKNVGVMIFEPTPEAVSWSALDYAKATIGLHQGFRYDDPGAIGNFNIDEVMGILHGLLFGLKLFLATASIITLMVGAAGVMNIMLVVVTERTREIGLRKAIGASNSAIFVQFLAESLCVTLISGLSGAVAGTGLVFLSARLIAKYGSAQIPPIYVPGNMLVIVGSLVVIGVVSGLLPSIRASRIEPAISLRA
jgi:putative ABC transport system permease protein